jgi:hypothetical protein
MPTKKPTGLLARHDLKTDRRKRADGEAALQPREPLRLKPPARLTGHPVASTLWRRMIAMYNGLGAEIVTRLDQDMLVDYCLLDEQSGEMDRLRAAAMKNYERAQRTLDRTAEKGEFDLKLLIKWQDSVNCSLGEVVKLDARVDRKRALLHDLRQSLYLTPRSRAGVAPPEKPPKEPKSEMAKIIDETPPEKPPVKPKKVKP